MEFVRKTIKVGNSAGVLLPRRLLGSEVRILILNKPVNIKKEVIKALNQDLEDLFGIFLISKNPIEVLAVSESTKKILSNEKIKIIIVPLSIIKKDIKTKPELIKKILNAEAIFNKAFLLELQKEIKSKASYNKVITSKKL